MRSILCGITEYCKHVSGRQDYFHGGAILHNLSLERRFCENLSAIQ
jgi:hypothetical protein